MNELFISFVGLIGRIVAKAISLLPPEVRASLGDLIGILWFDVFRIRRRVAIENTAIAFPQLSQSERTTMARWSLRYMGRTLIEFSLFPFFKAADIPKHFDFVGMEHAEAARAKGKGVILLTLHVGNGDFAVAALSRLGWPISFISKTFRSKWLNDLWFGMRKRHGTKFIAPEKSSFEILRALKANAYVVFVLDQFMGPPVGCKTLFFGRETGTAMGLALMAERTQAAVVPCFTYRKADGRHVVAFEPEVTWVDAGPNASRQENIAAMTQLYTDKLEEIIRQHPEQWMWIHRRWKNFG